MKHVERVLIKDNYKYYKNPIDIERYLFASKYVTNCKVLDIACGTGYGSTILANNGALKVEAVDIDGKTIMDLNAKKTEPSNLAYTKGSVYEIPFDNQHFDLSISIETFEHLKDPHLFLKELQRVTKINGKIIISTPLNEADNRFHPQNPFHVREYNKVEFEDILKCYFNSIEFHFQSSVLKKNWLTRLIDTLENYGFMIRKVKHLFNKQSLNRIRKLLLASKDSVVSSNVTKENKFAHVIIAVCCNDNIGHS